MRYVILMLALTGCPKSEAPTAPKARSPQIGANLPQDATSKDFIGNLVDTQFKNFRPVDGGGGASLNYDLLSFRPDGSWSATGAVDFGDEKMECVESGSWDMEAATSKTEAVVSWDLNNTDCAGQKPGRPLRAKITLSNGGQYKFQFR